MEARTPDDSQLIQIGGTGANIPSGGDEPDAPPGLYTAIQEQLGLKLEPVSQTLSLLIMPRNPQPFSELNRSRTPEIRGALNWSMQHRLGVYSRVGNCG
jgi:hypothetical protein